MAILVAAFALVPAAEARKKKRPVKAYSPPYAAFVVDVNSGRVLHDTASNALRHPASVTKVMTLYLLFEQMERGRFRMDSELRVSAEAQRQAPSKLGLRAGTTISVEDAIKALITKSANDVSVVIAEAVAGDHEKFARMMTAKARALGMSRTVFRNANGLPDPAQVTTARDLATLGRAIHDRFPKQYALFSIRSFEYDGWTYRNHNRLLGKVEGVDGIKTGYTRASGFNLLTSAKADGRHIITVVLGGRSARARDLQVAELVETHLPRAYAGRRKTPRLTDIARLDDTDDEESEPTGPGQRKPAPRVAEAGTEPARPTALPTPPGRPRPAVIAEAGLPNSTTAALSRARPLALTSSGSTNIVQSATNPLALVGQAPPRPVAPRQELVARQEVVVRGDRPVPPGSVRFTNSLPATPIKTEEEQPLPASPQAAKPDAKSELRVSAARAEREPNASASRPVGIAAIAPAPESKPPAQRPIPAATAAPAPAAKPLAAVSPKPAPKATPPRVGWVIQLAAAESEAKARGILDSAREKGGRLLKDAEPFTQSVSKGNTTLYRARFAGFDARDEADQACKQLKRSGFSCFSQKL